MDRFVLNVKDYRLEEGITQIELSENTGISRKTIAILEQSSGCNPNLGTLSRIAAYFNVSIDQLVKAQIVDDDFGDV